MHKIIWSLFVLVAISFFSCTDEGPAGPDVIECEAGTIDLDTIALEPASLQFVSYSGSEIIVFKNETGDEARFEPTQFSFNHYWIPIQFSLLCSSGDTNQYTMIRESYSFNKTCELLGLRMTLTVSPLNSLEQPIFVDKLNLFLNAGNSLFSFDSTTSINITTSLRGNEDFSNSLRFLNYKYGFTSDTTLLHKTFEDAYYTIKPQGQLLRSVFYTKDQGLVAFQDLQDVMWVFDRFE